MKSSDYLSADEFCISWNIDLSFIKLLKDSELIELEVDGEKTFIHFTQLRQLERLICFYYDLDINIEGIETVVHLLKQISELHDENLALRNRLHLFEKS